MRTSPIGLEKGSNLEFLSPEVLPASQGYERWALTYDDGTNPLLAREERHLEPLLNDLRSKSVLDLACGTGRWLEKLSGRGCKSGVGIDLSAAMLRVASNKNALRGRLARAECEVLPLGDAAFDLVICSFALGHIRELGDVTSELERVTKIGADIFVSDLHPRAHASGWRVGFRSCGASVQIEVHPRSVEEIVTAFCSSQFEYLGGVSLHLGEPERPLFVRAGKINAFDRVRQVPAVLVCHFRRTGSTFAPQVTKL